MKKMTFVKAIRNFFVKGFDFEGRASRAEYWWIELLGMILWIVGYLLGLLFPGNTFLWIFISTIVDLVILVPSFAITWRRLHDIGRSGVNFLWILLPIPGVFILLAYMLKKGDEGPNEYGPDPKAE